MPYEEGEIQMDYNSKTNRKRSLDVDPFDEYERLSYGSDKKSARPHNHNRRPSPSQGRYSRDYESNSSRHSYERVVNNRRSRSPPISHRESRYPIDKQPVKETPPVKER